MLMADSDSDAERSLAPSAKRLKDAREEGQVPRARELATLFMVGGAIVFLLLGGRHLLDGAERMMRNALTLSRESAMTPSAMTDQLSHAASDAFTTFMPLLILCAVGAVVGMLALGGWNFTTKAFQLKFERMDPLNGVKRMFTLHTLGEIGKAVLAASLVGGLVVGYLYQHVPELMNTAGTEVQVGIRLAGSEIAGLLGWLLLPLIIIGAVDALLAWWRNYRDLKMTIDEMKRESKETEGNPEIKGRIRQQQRELARRRMMSAVPKADVIVTNPTHYAVALSYQQNGARAPVVVAKGVDLTAARIRGIAAEHKVMIVEAPPLARALYKHVELEQEIPASLFSAVAQVLAYVYQIRAGVVNAELAQIDVPPGMDPGVQN
jgi:flagellar biosynthetic protein FlhB